MASKRITVARKEETSHILVPLPFSILIDTKEQLPYSFQGIESNADTKHIPFDVRTESVHLDYLGDYSIRSDTLGPWEQPRIMIERKSKSDLFTSVADRENFEWRLGRLCESCEFAAVVVEAEWTEIINDPPTYTKQGITHKSNLDPKSLHRTIQTWQQRFRGVHWCFYPNREIAEVATFWHLYRFHENLARHKQDRDRRFANHKAYLEGIKACRSDGKKATCPYEKTHAFGDLHDYWQRGYADMFKIKTNKALDQVEPPPIMEITNEQ